MLDTLKIATRKSPLALWQAEHVKQRLTALFPELTVEFVAMQTQGDRFLSASLATVGGKGLFIKELETALLKGEANIAVHSMKDVTIDLPEELSIPVILEREDSRDVLISNKYASVDDLPQGAVVGTSSIRRQSQLRARRQDLDIIDLRGNVGTRLGKLDAGYYDAIILAAAGVKRLGLEDRVTQFIEHDLLLPAIGQGAIGIECCADDTGTQEIILQLNHEQTAICVITERAFSKRLFGGCQLPIAAQASIEGQVIHLSGLVAHSDGSEVVTGELDGAIANPKQVGLELAEQLLSNGADKILHELLS